MKPFYPSFQGLGDWNRGGIFHLFPVPVELLANAKGFRLTGKGRHFTAVSWGQLAAVPAPADVRETLRKMVPIGCHIRKAHWALVANERSNSRHLTLEAGLKHLVRFYRVTPRVYKFLIDFYPKGEVDRLLEVTGRGVSLETLRVIEFEETLKWFKGDKVSEDVAALYRRNLSRLDCMRTCLDGVALVYQRLRKTRNIPSRALSALNQLKRDVWVDPWGAAAMLKDLATECRAYFFGGPCPRHPLVSWMKAVEALQFSYLARSLPAPLTSKAEKVRLITDLAARLCGPPPEEPPDWRPFVKTWLKRNSSGIPSLTCEPSVSSAIGYEGERWGHSAAYRDIWVFQLGHMHSRGRLREYLLETISEVDRSIKSSHMMDVMFLGDIRKSKVLNTFLLDGCETILDEILRSGNPLPAQPLVAPEKGLKNRIPTKGLTAANLVQQAFRKAADHFLKNDPRSSQSLGGSKAVDLSTSDGPWYSQDLTFATDLHGFWAQRVLYEEVLDYVPELRRWERFIPLLFGPRRLLLPLACGGASLEKFSVAQLPKPPKLASRVIVPKPGVIIRQGTHLTMYNNALPGVPLYELVDKDISQDEVIVFDLWFDEWGNEDAAPYVVPYSEMTQISSNGVKLARLPASLEDFIAGPKPPQVQQNPGKYSTDKSKPITSDTLLSFAKDYLAWNLLVCSDRLDGAGTVVTTRGAMMGEPTSWAALPLVTFYALNRVGKWLCESTGDDALVPGLTPQERRGYDDGLAAMGGSISLKKSFYHPKRGLFCEAPYVNGKKKKFFLLSYWAAPRGGSKGEANWFNLPAAFAGSLISQGLRPTRKDLGQFGLFKYSKFMSMWRAALNMGIPIGAPEIMGGINVPHFPVEPSRLQAHWFAYLSSLKLVDLHLFGGLSLVPQWDPQEMKSAKSYYDLVLSRQMTAEKKADTDILIEDAVSRIRNPGAVVSLFNRPRLSVLKHSPSVRNLAQKFYSRVVKAHPMRAPGSVTKLHEDILSKRRRYVASTGSFALMSQRNFGYAVKAGKPLAPRMWGQRLQLYDSIPVAHVDSLDYTA